MKISGYTAAFLLFVAVVAVGYQSPQSTHGQLNQTVDSNSVTTAQSSATSNSDAPSVDDIVATDVAANLAEQANLPIAPTVASTAVSLSVQNQLAQSDDTVVSKPQIIQPDSGSRTVRYYKATANDSVATIAKKFSVSEDTIRWANNLDSDAVPAGKNLTILPVSGVKIAYQPGESIASLAKKYHTSASRIISYNDLEITKPKKGQQLVIPGGILPASERPGYTPPQQVVTTPSYGGIGNGYTVNSSMLRASAGNRYAPGNCTWYAYERREQLGRPIGSFWGDGGSWAYSAQAAGYRVDHNPTPGSILVMVGSPGHVAIVEDVDSKTGNILISEMNNAAYGGFNSVDRRTISAGQASGYLYIH